MKVGKERGLLSGDYVILLRYPGEKEQVSGDTRSDVACNVYLVDEDNGADWDPVFWED